MIQYRVLVVFGDVWDPFFASHIRYLTYGTRVPVPIRKTVGIRNSELRVRGSGSVKQLRKKCIIL
jgi:hypothetical protein